MNDTRTYSRRLHGPRNPTRQNWIAALLYACVARSTASTVEELEKCARVCRYSQASAVRLWSA